MVAGGQNGCVKDPVVGPEIGTHAPGSLRVVSKTFRLQRKLQPYARAGFNKFPRRDEMCIYFHASFAECPFSVGLSRLHKEVSAICVCCRWLDESLFGRFRRATGLPGDTPVNCFEGCC